MDLNPGSSDSQLVRYSGTINATVVFDDETLKANTLQFTGGRVYATDLDLQFSGAILYYGYGTFFTSFRVRTWEVSAVYETIGLGTVNDDGSLIAAEHQLRIDRGSDRMDYHISGIGSDFEEQNYATTNLVSEISEGGRIDIQVESSSDLERTLLLTLTSETNDYSSDPIEDTNATLVTTEVGTTTAISRVTIPTGFGQWVSDNGIPPDEATSVNAQGISYRLLYVFDLDKESGVLPFSSTVDALGKPIVTIRLPASGLKEGLKAEYLNSLSNGSWQDLPGSYVVEGSNALDSGQTGMVHLNYPEGSQGFIRLATVE